MILDLIEFQFDIIGDEILAWKITLDWFHDGWNSAIRRFLKIALVK